MVCRRRAEFVAVSAASVATRRLGVGMSAFAQHVLRDERRREQAPLVEGQHAGHQLVEHHAEAVDVGPGVDVEPARLGLLRAHVGRRADGDAELGGEGSPSVSRCSVALAIPKSMMVGIGCPSVTRTRMLLGLRSRWMTPFWCACWTPAAHAEEELEPVAQIEAVPVAVVGDRLAGHQLHDEVGKALVGGAGVERAGDVGVIHHRERLPLALEAGEHLVGIHPEPDHLERDRPPERLELLGLVDGPHAALAEDAGDAVGADAVGVRERASARRRAAGRVGPRRRSSPSVLQGALRRICRRRAVWQDGGSGTHIRARPARAVSPPGGGRGRRGPPPPGEPRSTRDVPGA